MVLDAKAETALTVGDPGELQQIIMNLGTNAAQSMRDSGGTMTIRIDERLYSRGDRLPSSDMEPGSYFVLAVKDTGTGMTQETRRRIFEPFFTTKGLGHGTGMGLSVVYGIVRSYGGAITVDTKPGQGTTFEVFLRNAAEKEGAQGEQESRLPGGDETILFVDDEDAVTRMAQTML